MSIREGFVLEFGEAAAVALMAAAVTHEHSLRIDEAFESERGSDPFKWAILQVIGFQCVEVPAYRFAHRIPDELTFERFKEWVRASADLTTHDGGYDILAAYSGNYND